MSEIAEGIFLGPFTVRRYLTSLHKSLVFKSSSVSLIIWDIPLAFFLVKGPHKLTTFPIGVPSPVCWVTAHARR